ncbi:MAG: ABC transporter ATP-binding protein [Intestinibacter sp.]|uniref:amino acid ABC transporter ATP-binding/permease protein n=3 Tax=Intestinibacter sp. TaxID=1965304 RepID=UPI002A819E32|nr:ABC transporter ATP-binding protein [Intestinibacter sp.]MDY4575547.1 ABC transporter ATP-binding protein [Intestinibacter sp.]
MESRQSGIKIMLRLIKVLKPLAPIMMITISFGILGFLSATAITSFGMVAGATVLGFDMGISLKASIIIVIVCAILRGILRFIEQYSGHFIAFKILAILRDKVFVALRRLAPAKLESKEKGNLISIITSDIELLEVFYAHTVAPIAIGVVTSFVIAVVLFKINPVFGLLSVLFYILIGYFIPVFSSKFAKQGGVEYREAFADSNSYFLESLKGIKEILLFDAGEERIQNINQKSDKLHQKMGVIKAHEGIIRAFTDIVIMIAILTFLFVGIELYKKGQINIGQALVAIVVLSSSFGPVVALSNLSNNLIQTFACAQRLFDILDEAPVVEDMSGECELQSKDIKVGDISFYYENREEILKNLTLSIKKGEKVAIIGESGSGKSTLLKLIMRFWNVDRGEISIGDKNVKTIPTKTLRKSQTLVSQDTFLFNDTILNNIKMVDKNATYDDVVKAAKKASIHEFIMKLPKGYDTNVGELGGNLSSGEKQRLSIARAFLRDSDILILDEPTSNLDTLNEASILKSINDECKDKTIVMVSHRKSSSAICDKRFELKDKKLVGI